jgi:homoserine kinase type II
MDYDQFVKRILKDFDLGEPKSICRLETSGNIACKIITSRGKYFLRLSPNESMKGRNRAELLAEAEFLEHLYKNGLPVSEPVDNKIISVNGINGYIREYDDGRALDNPTTKQARIFGQLIGKMHTVSSGYITNNKRDHIWDLATTKQNLLEDKAIIENGCKGGKEFFGKLHGSLFAIDEPKRLPKGMIHEDLGKRHVLWKNGKISAIIDFDRCYYGYLVDDLGQAIRGWCFNTGSDFIEENYNALLGGYKKERELAKNEMIALPQSVKFAFLERSLSFVLRGIAKKDENLIDYARQQLNTAVKINSIFDR